jgi:hypothetical protein
MRGTGEIARLLAMLGMLLGALAIAAVPAGALMKSTKLDDGTCETTGGGRFVPIPGFPGEKIDRRLLTDLAWIEKRYPIFITDGYSLDPVHAANGEHPIGLAVDIIPNASLGGTWADITALALWVEPTQDHPIVPFRWVGYKGDAGHGPRNHLHISWSHSESTRGPGYPVRTVYTLKCPSGSTAGTGLSPPPPAGGAVVDETPGNHGHGKRHHHHHQQQTGAVDGTGSSSGGIGKRLNLAPVVPEAGE